MGLRGTFGILVASSMILGSTAAVAGPVAPTTRADPWAMLSVMNGGASAVAVCGAAAAAAAAAATAATTVQPGGGCVIPQVDVAPVVAQPGTPVPPPPPPVPVVPVVAAAPVGLGLSPLMLGLAALAAALGAYLIVNNNGNSPA